MNELELREKKLSLQEELKSLISNGEAEKRELNEEENSKMAELRAQMDEIDNELTKIEKENRQIKENNKDKTIEKKMANEVSLFGLIREVANNNISEESRQFINGNEINFRDIQATVTDHGKENIPTFKEPLELAIRNASVLDKLGARWYDANGANIKLVKYEGSNTYWTDSENAQAQSGDTTFTEITLEPKRLSSSLIISRQFLDQSPENAEGILIGDLARSVAEKIDKTIFSAVEGDSHKPSGLFADSGYTASGSALTAITFDDVLELENRVEKKNGVDYVFVTEPSVKFALRGTQTASGRKMVWEGNELDGRKAIVSNSVNAKSLLALDPMDLACATFNNGLRIVVDPYSLADKNQIKIVVNYLFDAKVKGKRIAGTIFS